MAAPIDPPRSATPPIVQFLAEAALQRQSILLGTDTSTPAVFTPPPGGPAAPPVAPSALAPALATPIPVATDQASISREARELMQGSGMAQPRRSDGETSARLPRTGEGPASGPQRSAVSQGAGAAPLAAGTPAAVAVAWPSQGLDAPLLRLVSALVAQVTAEVGVPQRVVSAQAWPQAMAQALESGALDAEQPTLQTWLVRQGVLQTPEGPRGLAMALRTSVPWLAAQAPAASSGTAPAPTALRLPFSGAGSALQSGVIALVLQGMESGSPRTSALLALDLQPALAASVYGRDALQPHGGRLDPWTHVALLQVSGQVPRDGAAPPALCDTPGCPYAGRAACVQPFCWALREMAPVVRPLL